MHENTPRKTIISGVTNLFPLTWMNLNFMLIITKFLKCINLNILIGLIQNVFDIIIKNAEITKIDEKKNVSIDVPLKLKFD